MIAADYGDKLPENIIPLEGYGVSVVKSAVIYGANASGKSNLLKAMVDAADFIIRNLERSRDEALPHPYNKNYEGNNDSPTQYIFGIFVKQTYFEYRFSYTDIQIFEEQLIEFSPDSQKCHFYRQYNPQTKKYDWLEISNEFKERVDIFKLTLNKANLFLSILANLDDDNDLKSGIIDDIYTWFKKRFAFDTNFESPGRMNYLYSLVGIEMNNEVKNLMLKLLKKSDFLIKDFKVEIEQDSDDDRISAKTYHQGKDIQGQETLVEYDFFEEESVGTQQFVAWIVPWLLTVMKNYVMVIDEFGNNMHPLLAESLLDFFHERSDKAQLIFTTHDVKLMNREQLRDDQIWFVNRDKTGNSTLEPFSNYDIEEDKLLDYVYLQGVLGGVPQIETALPELATKE
ncbi:ATP-binding protein [Anaerolineales bacterium HSG6]|nr:ATP-binding protein [Anaerolineales bacterium HSG6]